MSSSCLRRTKEMENKAGVRLVSLPPVHYYVVRVDLSMEDREAYDLAMNASRRRFEEYVQNDRSGSVGLYALPTEKGFTDSRIIEKLPPNVLQLLTRLRQLALLSTLVPPNYIDDIQKDEQRHASTENLSDEVRRRLLFKLKAAVDDAEECPICFDALTKPRITMCGHSYCLDCITQVISTQAKCKRHPPVLQMCQSLPVEIER